MSDTWDLSEDVPIRLFTRDSANALANADSTPTIEVTKPDGTTLSPALTFTNSATGTYDTELPAASTTAGLWSYVTTATIGGITIKEHKQFTVVGSGVASAPLYLEFEEFKASLTSVPSAIDGQAGIIMRALRAACRKIDDECHRHFYATAEQARVYPTASNVYYDRAAGLAVLLTEDIAVDDVTVEVGSAFSSTWTTLASTSWELWPLGAAARRRPYEGIAVSGSWSGTRARITTRYGWPEVPDVVPMATQILGARYVNRRTSPEGTTSGSAEFGGAVPLRRTDPDVFELIKHLVRPLS